jgi:hypothetical protein
MTIMFSCVSRSPARGSDVDGSLYSHPRLANFDLQPCGRQQLPRPLSFIHYVSFHKSQYGLLDFHFRNTFEQFIRGSINFRLIQLKPVLEQHQSSQNHPSCPAIQATLEPFLV